MHGGVVLGRGGLNGVLRCFASQDGSIVCGFVGSTLCMFELSVWYRCFKLWHDDYVCLHTLDSKFAEDSQRKNERKSLPDTMIWQGSQPHASLDLPRYSVDSVSDKMKA